MNFNIYLNNELYEELESYRKIHNTPRNKVISEALNVWLKANKSKAWPKSFFYFPDDVKNLYPDVSELRKDLVSE